MSFAGDSFLSYGTAIARKVTHKGKSAIIVNDCNFSSTTSSHQSELRIAIPSEIPCFHFSEGMGARLEVKPSALFDYAVERSAECLAKSEKARQRKDDLKGEAARWLERAREVAEFFGLKRKIDEGTVQRLKASKERAEKAQARKEALQAEARRILAQKDYDAWKRGEDVSRGAFHDFPVAFRVEGKELVSSLGARVPVKDAKRALRFVKSHRGHEWRENGETCPVGGYRVNSITPHGIVAGCHRISWDEIANVESLIG